MSRIGLSTASAGMKRAWAPLLIALAAVSAAAAPPAPPKSLAFGLPRSAGAWEDISPNVDYAKGPTNYGLLEITGGQADEPDTFYVGVGNYDGAGIWKSTDTGDHWFNVSGNQLRGSASYLVQDFADAKTLYTLQLFGYGSPCCGDGGVAKSTDGGVTWRQVANKVGVGTTTVMNNDLGTLKMDPTDHLHLLAEPHSAPWVIYETFDGGDTWWIHPGFANGAATALFTGQDDDGTASGTVWIYQAEHGGTWRTATGGRVGGTKANRYRDGTPDPAAWTQVMTRDKTHGASALTRLSNNDLLMSVDVSIVRSHDNGATWVDMAARAGQGGDLPNSGDALAGLGNDGTYIWTMMSNTGCGTAGPYQPLDFPAPARNNCGSTGYRWLVTPVAGDGTHWSEMGSQVFQNGTNRMLYDARHRTLYSVNWCTGLFRLKLP